MFVLLAHYFAEESLTVSLITASTSRSRSSIDIGATVAKHSGIVPQLIAAHAVSRCDTVGCYHGIGKTKVVKALSAGIELNHSGDPKSSLDDDMKESTHFIGACYGQRSAIHPTQCLQSATKHGYHTLGERGPLSFRN